MTFHPGCICFWGADKGPGHQWMFWTALYVGYQSTHFLLPRTHTDHQATWGLLAFCAMFTHSQRHGKWLTSPHATLRSVGAQGGAPAWMSLRTFPLCLSHAALPTLLRRGGTGLHCLRFPASPRSWASGRGGQSRSVSSEQANLSGSGLPQTVRLPSLDSIIGKTNPSWLKILSSFALHFDLNFEDPQSQKFHFFFCSSMPHGLIAWIENVSGNNNCNNKKVTINHQLIYNNTSPVTPMQILIPLLPCHVEHKI